MDDVLLNRELNAKESDNAIMTVMTEREKERFASELKAGLGDDVVRYLQEGNTPLPVNKPIAMRFGVFIRKLCRIFSIRTNVGT